MKAETIRRAIDRAMGINHSVQCNCKNKHSFNFLPVAYHPVLKMKMIYGLLFDCEIPVGKSNNFDEFVHDDEWLYVYHVLQIDNDAGVISLTKIDEDMKISAIIEFPLKDVKDIITLKMPEDYDWETPSLKRIRRVTDNAN